MVKVEVINEDFTLEKFDELKNIERKSQRNVKGKLYKGDTFECSEEMAKYLTGNNPLKKVVARVIEVIPEKEIKVVTEEKAEEKTFVKPKKKNKK